uniref:Synaptobrevin, longin-like domain protein n=1 Tax=Tanacetum cinerariifolium TaxID=118510 RepID=A0A6L2LU14_TANCI|nr:hypothetical protein [Tanacetum cinerariifolium]
MALTFADTHNMIAFLTKYDASEGFDQIIDFLNASTIQYELTINHNIYVSVIKQFWSSVAVNKVNDVTRLQALLDRKKVLITEETIREALRLDDAESIDCLPNEEIFAELARMGYEKPSTKLTFYKAFFSSQWKFLIHTILQCMSAKRTSWNEFSSSMASTVICLSTGRKFNFSKYIFDSLVRNVDSSSKFYMYPQFLQLMIRAQVGDLSSHTIKYSSPAMTQKVFANMRRVGKGFSGVETLLFVGMIVTQQVDDVVDEGAAGDNVDVVPTAGVNIDDVPVADAEPFIPSPPPTTQLPPPSPEQEQPSTSQVIPTPPPSPIAQSPSPPQQQPPSQPSHDAGILMDLLQTLLETCTTLTRRVENLDDDKIAQALEITKLKQRVKKLEMRNKLKVSKLRRLKKDGTAQRVETSDDAVMDDVLSMQDDESEPAKLKEVVEVVTTAKLMTEVVTAAAITTEKDDERKPQTEAQARKNMIIYLRNMAEFKMDYFKGMSYDEIRPIFEKYFNSNVAFLEKTKEQMEEEDSKALKRKFESSEEKAAKKQKLDEEVSVVDYELYTENNKPYYKIKRADGSHQLYLSFLSMLRNFDREDLEVLWKLVKERFASSKPKNFSDDFLLTTLGAMFEKPDVQTEIWRN